MKNATYAADQILSAEKFKSLHFFDRLNILKNAGIIATQSVRVSFGLCEYEAEVLKNEFLGMKIEQTLSKEDAYRYTPKWITIDGEYFR